MVDVNMVFLRNIGKAINRQYTKGQVLTHIHTRSMRILERSHGVQCTIIFKNPKGNNSGHRPNR